MHSHYRAQSNASFWNRPRNAALSREINNLSLARLNEIYGLKSKSKVEAVRRIMYDSGFSYDGVLPPGALNGDPQFTSYYDEKNIVTAYSVSIEHLKTDVKKQGYDCTGSRQKSLYLQALAGNKTARERLEVMCRGSFPSHPREAWLAIEKIQHEVYKDYLNHCGCVDRFCNHPMYPAIPPPLPNPVKLRMFVARARKAHDIDTLSWMLGRCLEPTELSKENSEHLVRSVLNRFGYTATELAAMESILNEQKNDTGKAKEKESANHRRLGDFLLGCCVIFAPILLLFGILYVVSRFMERLGAIGNLIGSALLLSLLVVIFYVVFPWKKGRPP